MSDLDAPPHVQSGSRPGNELSAPAVELTSKQRQYLKSLAHGLDPVVQVGSKGVSETLITQIQDQLAAHELIKVRFNTECAVEPADAAPALVAGTKSQLVQKTGRILILYRRHVQKPKIELPKAKRAPRPAAAS